VCLAYLPDMEIGEYTIVHAGFAITRLDEASANETLQMFADLGILSEELGLSEESGASEESGIEELGA
jgi:hydrogenase expression/formation protein HypC